MNFSEGTTKNKEISSFYGESHLQLTLKDSCSILLNSRRKVKNTFFLLRLIASLATAHSYCAEK